MLRPQVILSASFLLCSLWSLTLPYSHAFVSSGPLRVSRPGGTLASATTTADEPTKTKKLTLFSPCKINLFLRVIRKRPDGYHDLASLFQAVGFGDTLSLELVDGQEDVLTCNMEDVPTDSSNLVLRALDLMRKKTSQGSGLAFRVHLEKQCPAQAGLGGGSANAATAMFGFNELMGNPATQEQLVEWSGDLGSDITFFLSRGTAYCTGRGEIMTPVDPPLAAGTKVCIVKPRGVGLSTPTVFKSLKYDALSSLDPQDMLDTFTQKPLKKVENEWFVNDLEPPAFFNLPDLEQLKQRLSKVQGFQQVMMSGSGTSLFCIGHPEDMDAFEQTFITENEETPLDIFFSEFINRPSEAVWFERP